MTYWPDGQVNTITDPNSQKTTRTYDVFGRLYVETRPDGGTTTYTYLNQLTVFGTPLLYNSIVTSVDGSRSITKNEFFDGSGFTYSVQQTPSDCASGVTAVDTQKDSAGRPYKTSLPYCVWDTPQWTTTTYDIAGRVSTVTKPDGKLYTYTYGNYLTYEHWHLDS